MFFLQLKNVSDVVRDVLGHMISVDNPSCIAVNKGWLCLITFCNFYINSSLPVAVYDFLMYCLVACVLCTF